MSKCTHAEFLLLPWTCSKYTNNLVIHDSRVDILKQAQTIDFKVISLISFSVHALQIITRNCFRRIKLFTIFMYWLLFSIDQFSYFYSLKFQSYLITLITTHVNIIEPYLYVSASWKKHTTCQKNKEVRRREWRWSRPYLQND